MIIQTGMRTDIPAFYSEWLANRIKEGYVLVRNPYNPLQVTRYDLSPEVVDLITFCTKNPKPMFPYMDLLQPYGQYWFVTITPYGKEIEPGVPNKDEVIEILQKLSLMVGADCIGWRYDPIFISDDYPLAFHLQWFEETAAKMEGYTHTCVISFIDLYEKVLRNFPEVKAVEKKDRLAIGEYFAEIGRKHGLVIKSCGEGRELERFEVDCNGCMTVSTYEKALKGHLCIPKQAPKRPECTCFLGNDIGAYHTCGHLCRYCYANDNAVLVRENRKHHNPNSPFMIGESRPEDVIHQAKQEKWLDTQMSLFDYMDM